MPTILKYTCICLHIWCIAVMKLHTDGKKFMAFMECSYSYICSYISTSYSSLLYNFLAYIYIYIYIYIRFCYMNAYNYSDSCIQDAYNH